MGGSTSGYSRDARGLPASTRYTLTAQALHWLTVALILAVLPLAWVVVSMPRDNPDRAWLFVLHRSVGLTILALVIVRLAWRALNPPPPLPGGTSKGLELVGRATHWLLYAAILLMPISGYLQSGNGKPVSYLGLFDIPGIPKNETVDGVARVLHLGGQWAIYGLVALHVLATAWHVAIRRDGLLSRMLPPQDLTARRPG